MISTDHDLHEMAVHEVACLLNKEVGSECVGGAIFD